MATQTPQELETMVRGIGPELATVLAHTDMTIPPDTPLDVLQTDLTAVQDLCDAPAPPGATAGDCDRRLRDHIARLQRRIDAFDEDL